MSLCPICESPLCPNSNLDGYTVISFDAGLPITPADLGLDIDLDAIVAELVAEEFKARIENALAEVEIGNALTNDEGQVLASYVCALEDVLDETEGTANDLREQLIAEEQAHSETLADLFEAQDRVAELEAQVATQERLLKLASAGLTLAARTIEDAARERALISVFYGI